MLDQSFSTENFRKIFDEENRKGNDVASHFFPIVKDINANIKSLKKKIKAEKDDSLKEKLNEQLNEQKERKETELSKELEKLSFEINAKKSKGKYQLKLEKSDEIASKPVYLIQKDALSFFVVKQIQKNIHKLYKVKQSDRHQIVSQLFHLLNNQFPKHLIRTDIKEFYESIPQDKLLEIIERENLLSFSSKQYIKAILKEYQVLSGKTVGIPRGIGVSAYLAELYMREFDSHIKDDDEVIFYARYVDDIVVLYAPKPDTDTSTKLKKFRDQAAKLELLLNDDKSKTFEYLLPKPFKFDFLGYEFSYDEKTKTINLDISDKKLAKYKFRIEKCFKNYIQTESLRRAQARKKLISRVEFLTSNTKLYGNKTGTLVGVYFSNKLITKLDKLSDLDSTLLNEVAKLKTPQLQAKLSIFSFRKGFVKKIFHAYSVQDIGKIVKVWS